jgi:hypothetical protein
MIDDYDDPIEDKLSMGQWCRARLAVVLSQMERELGRVSLDVRPRRRGAPLPKPIYNSYDVEMLRDMACTMSDIANKIEHILENAKEQLE